MDLLSVNYKYYYTKCDKKGTKQTDKQKHKHCHLFVQCNKIDLVRKDFSCFLHFMGQQKAFECLHQNISLLMSIAIIAT